MCGIAGIVAWDNRYRVTRETLTNMSARIAHRGPDGEGLWINHEQEISPDRPQCGLVHRRLAILDPDPRSNQPFTDGRHWLVFNGEIYNFRDLRDELTSIDRNYEWRTTGDTEVLLRSYAIWRDKCVEHFNGMFAFAIWDEQERTLFLARDRMGQKPLYFSAESYSQRRARGAACRAEIGGFFAFGSELGTLRALAFAELKPRLESIGHYLKWGYTDWTVYGMSFTVGPAGRLSLPLPEPLPEDGRSFNPNPITCVISDNEARRLTRELVTKAVHRQLVSDVPLGCFLSGGIDSSVIATCARAEGPLETFSIAFDDPQYDESPYADAVAKHLGTTHHVFHVRPQAIEDLPKLAEVFGEPFADSSALPTHYLARETRKFVKVALSGDGGDENCSAATTATERCV
jgi:asparagine synthase (glutamine-hydrolysing)